MVIIAIVGLLYGVITHHYFESIQPTILKDKYPHMDDAPIVNFDYINYIGIIPWSAVIWGSVKIGFLATFEVIISGYIGQTKYSQKNNGE